MLRLQSRENNFYKMVFMAAEDFGIAINRYTATSTTGSSTLSYTVISTSSSVVLYTSLNENNMNTGTGDVVMYTGRTLFYKFKNTHLLYKTHDTVSLNCKK